MYKDGEGVFCMLCSEASDNRTDSPAVIQENKTETIQGLVSVIMPVYNTQYELLKAAVNSVLKQSYRELELIIVDDGSEKTYAILCDELATQDDRVNVIHIKNAGASTARNYGIEESRGEYIAFIDSDDTMAVNLLQEFINQIVDVDFVVCGCKHARTIQSDEYVNVNGERMLRRKECIGCLCYMNPPYDHIETNAIWGKLYRKSLMGNIRFDQSMIMAEDFKFNFEYILNVSAGKYLDFQGYSYYEHSDSTSRSYKPAMMNTIDAIKQMVQDYKESDVFDALISRCVNIAFTILMMVPRELKEEQREIERFINVYRIRVVKNNRTKKKVKIATVSSFLSYKLTRLIDCKIRDKMISKK